MSAKPDFLERLRSVGLPPQPKNYDAFSARRSPAVQLLPRPRPRSRTRKRTTAEENRLAEQVQRKLQNPKAYPLMSVEEVAFVCVKSPATIYRWREEGKLASPKIGGRILTRSVKALLRKNAPTSK